MLLRALILGSVVMAGGTALRAEAPLLWPAEAQAEVKAPAVPAEVAALTEAMRIGEVMSIMREEGVEYGGTLEEEMFPGRGGSEWRAVVGLIYDTATMRSRFDAVFAREMVADPEAMAAATEFFTSDLGARIIELEIEARRALLEDAVEEAARVMAEDMMAGGEPRMDALQAFAETNDLIESNVSGALNANLAFYKGLAEGGALEDDIPEDQMLADVWSQEPEVRADTEDWLYSYLALAYQPLSDDDLAAYHAFSDTPAGQKLNAALFAAFDEMFTQMSFDLGRAAARQMQGEDI